MKNLELKDRIVVEFLAPKNEVELTPDFVAGQLRAVADAIQAGRSGDNYIPWQDNEVLWEHESARYGEFRIVSDKPLISQYYYGSESKPLIISERTKNNVEEWLKKMSIRNEDKEYIHTDGDLVDYAYPIMNQIISETK